MPNIVINQLIHGRAYVIEVVAVAEDRWRAQLSRRGATTALMPFYGATPDEAARLLSGWLARANAASAPAAAPGGKRERHGNC